MKKAISFTLLENAESFVNEAIEKALAAEKEPSEWKFAILNLAHAIELVLKEILRREHWTLVFQNIDKRTQTVSLEGALERLTNVVKIRFSDVDLSAIRTAINLRNHIVHYEFAFEAEHARLIFVKLLGFIQHCFGQYLGKLLHEVVVKELWEEAIELFEFSEELSRRAIARLAAEGLSEALRVECPRCNWDFFIPRTYDGSCYVCGYEDAIETCAVCRRVLISSGGEILYGVMCCDYCVDRGVVVGSDGKASSLADYQEVETETGDIYLSRKATRV